MSAPILTGISYAYPDTPAQERASLALSGGELRDAYRRVSAAGGRLFLLSTCLRLEAAAPGDESHLDEMLQIAFPNVRRPDAGIVRFDRDEIAHLFHVAGGVESPVLGEPEVLGQFRSALEAGRSEGAIGGMFERVLAEAIQAGRTIRRLLPAGSRGSLAGVAARLCESSAEVAVLGAGTMARAVVEALGVRGSRPAVTVFARRPEAVEIQGVRVEPMELVREAVIRFPAVVSATSARRTLAIADLLEESIDRRSTDLLLVDLAMPPDFRPPSAPARVRYFGVDDLAGLALPAGLPHRVTEYVEAASSGLTVRLANHGPAAPVIEAMLARADEAVEEEVARFAPRIGAGSSEREILRQLAHTVARRILHQPVSFLSTQPGGDEAADALARAFEVDGD